MIFQRVSSPSFSLVLYEFRARQEIQYFIFFILLSVKFNYKMLLFGGSHDAVMLFFFPKTFLSFVIVATDTTRLALYSQPDNPSFLS